MRINRSILWHTVQKASGYERNHEPSLQSVGACMIAGSAQDGSDNENYDMTVMMFIMMSDDSDDDVDR